MLADPMFVYTHLKGRVAADASEIEPNARNHTKGERSRGGEGETCRHSNYTSDQLSTVGRDHNPANTTRSHRFTGSDRYKVTGSKRLNRDVLRGGSVPDDERCEVMPSGAGAIMCASRWGSFS